MAKVEHTADARDLVASDLTDTPSHQQVNKSGPDCIQIRRDSRRPGSNRRVRRIHLCDLARYLAGLHQTKQSMLISVSAAVETAPVPHPPF